MTMTHTDTERLETHMNEIVDIEKNGAVSLPLNATDNPLMVMAERALTDPNVDVDKLEAFIGLVNKQQDRQREIEREDRGYMAKVAFEKDYVAAKAKMPQIVKDAFNKHNQSHYATIQSVDASITPIMSAHGFGIRFQSGDNPVGENFYHGIADLIHKGGHSERFEDRRIPIAGEGTKGNRAMTDIQGHGATKTYARRYMTFDIWGLAVMDADNDGNVNNMSPLAEHYLDKMAKAKTIPELEKIGAEITTDKTLKDAALVRVRKAYTFSLRALKNA